MEIESSVFNNIKGDSNVKSYLKALSDPFSPEAVGIRIPDPYPYPTIGYRSEGLITVTSNSSGIASVLLLPHPFLSLVNMCNTSTISTTMTNINSSTGLYAAITPT